MELFQRTNTAQAASTPHSTPAAAASIGLMGYIESGQSGQCDCFSFWPQMPFVSQLDVTYVSTSVQKADDPYFAKAADLYRLKEDSILQYYR